MRKETIISRIGHCETSKISKKELLKLASQLKNKKSITKKIEASGKEKFLMVLGNTQIMGYLLVIQTITKKYKGCKVVLASGNLSIYSI